MAILDVLKSCELFFELYDEEIERVLKSQPVTHYEVDEPIVTEGEIGDQIYIVLEGVAEICKNTDRGTVRVEKLRQSDVFGLMILLDDKPYGINVVARTKCSVLEIKHRHIMSLFGSNPRIFSLICLNISRILGKRLRAFQKRLAELQHN